ncbi:MAG: serine acetyltransferase [Eubacteriales bacterium]
MKTKHELKELLIDDARKYIGEEAFFCRKRIQLQITHSAYRYTCLLRRATYYQSKNKLYYGLLRMRVLRLSIKYGYQIGVGATIGGGLYLGHRGTIIINKKVTMGNNISLSPGVTVGQENRGKRQGTPTFGNKIWIGTNAVVVGKIKIGDDVLIAPNAYVNFDVPSSSVVMGNPAKIIANVEATKGYL